MEKEKIVEQINAIFEKNDIEKIQALLNPRIIVEGKIHLKNANGTMTYPLLICDNPDTQIKEVPNQLNFILPSIMKNSTDPYVINIRNDLNMYRITYEQYSKDVNTIIKKTKESMKNLYAPLKTLKKDIQKNSKIYENSIKQLPIPLKNEEEHLNKINYTLYSEENQKEFLKDKEEIILKINDFCEEANQFCVNYVNINKNILEEIEEFAKNCENLAVPAIELSTFMDEFFRAFEKSSKYFDDLSNKEKISIELEKIKNPINNFQNKIESINKLLIPVEDIKNSNKIENINKINKENNEIRESLIRKSEMISKLISNIREKYGEPKKDIKTVEIPESKVLNISGAKEILEKEKDKINSDVKEGVDKINEKNIIIKNQTRLDLLFIMDITNSMDLYLDQAKNSILNMMEEIKKNCAGIDIYLGFIGYRDFTDLDFGYEYVNLDLTTDYEAIKKEIEPLRAQGGGDIPEDLCGAFEFSTKKSWEGKSRFAILVTDSPCHGTKYHDLKGDNVDNYSNGDKDGRNIEEFIKFFAENEISLFCLKINSTTDKMFGIFKEVYEKNKKPNSNSQFIVGEGETLSSVVIENAVKTFQNRKELEIK